MRLTLAERFWAKVEKTDGCWFWRGNRSPQGYGQISENDRLVAAHRVSWRFHFGAIPDGLRVLHSCDVRGCVRPSHLFLGTQADNLVDMVRKGRCYNARLSPSNVAEIRRMTLAGVPSPEIAAVFSIHPAHARKVGRRKAWAHVS
jgi:hypothetical protein